MFLITFECLSEYDKRFQMKFLWEHLTKQRRSESVINMVEHGLINDDRSKLYEYLGTEGSYFVPEKFFLQLASRSRQLEQLHCPEFKRLCDSRDSIFLCPHSPEGLTAFFEGGYGYTNTTSHNIYSAVHINLRIYIDYSPDYILDRSPLGFESREEGLNFYYRIQSKLRSSYKALSNAYILDGGTTPEELHRQICDIVKHYIPIY